MKRTLRRLLLGGGACIAVLLALYIGLSAVTSTLERTRTRFHIPAITAAGNLSATLAKMEAPPGVAPSFVDKLDRPEIFVASVGRDTGRARELLESLLTLHRQEADAAFDATTARIDRALQEFRSADREFASDPVALARAFAVRPHYATIVAEQVRRQHLAADRALQQRLGRARQAFGGLFMLVSVLLVIGFGVQMRRSLKGIDAVLDREQRTLETLRTSRAALQEAQSLARLGSWELDLQQGSLSWSEEMYRLSGFDLHGPSPTPADWLARIDANDRPVMAAAFASPSPETVVALKALRIRLPDGRLRHLSLGARLVRDADGKPCRLLGTAQDVTERRLAEEALARSHDELEQLVAERTAQLTVARDTADRANQAKSEFLSRMSHELRTPMNAVLGFAQLLGLEPSMTPKSREYVDQVLRAGKHLLKLISEVLDLAHVESGRVTLSPEPVAIDPLIRDVVALMRPVAKQSGVVIELDLLGACVLRGDRLRVKQVLINLLSNAIKYNRPGGWVRIGTSLVEGDRVRVWVADSGQGIATADVKRLFEPFNRLGAESGPVEGSGIGLSICKRLVEMMGGTVGVESRPGIGSKFWVDLPADQIAPAPTTPVDSKSDTLEPNSAVGCVLYVEDNPANVMLVQEIVARHPHLRLVTAQTALLGFDLAQSHRPDLMLLDIHLPDMSGYALLAKLRAQDTTRSIPAVAVTANAMPGEAEKARAAGFAAFVTKPLNVAGLDALLREHLGRKSAEHRG